MVLGARRHGHPRRVIPLACSTTVAALVWWLHRDGRNEAAYAVAFAPVAAAGLGQGFTSFLHQQRNPPDKADAPSGAAVEASFPSGHTTGVTAEALAIAYVLQNEGLSSAPVLAASALLYAGLRTHTAGPAPTSEGEGENRMVALQPQASQ